MTEKELYEVCDLVLLKLKESKKKLAPIEMGLKTHSIIDKEAVKLLNENDLISFVGKEVEFDKFCTITTKGLGVKNGVEKYLKPKPYWRKPEFIIPTLIAFIALIVPFITRSLDNKEPKEHNSKQEIIALSDSVSKVLFHQQDSLLRITNNRIDSLSTLHNSNFDFKK